MTTMLDNYEGPDSSISFELGKKIKLQRDVSTITYQSRFIEHKNRKHLYKPPHTFTLSDTNLESNTKVNFPKIIRKSGKNYRKKSSTGYLCYSLKGFSFLYYVLTL